MIIVYSPADGEKEEFDASTLRVSEVSIVQRTIDMKWDDIKAGLANDDPEAMRGVAWVIKKRSNPPLRYAEFDPGIEEIDTRLDKKEVRAWIGEALSLAAANPEVTGDDIAKALSGLPDAAQDPEHARQLIAEMTQDPKEEPAAPQEAAEASDSDPSRTPTSTTPAPTTSDSSPTSSTSRRKQSTT
ncbi:hypothetical protein OH768_24960 [Streptomyces sp. NBC_01622]|uniref:hypothetical protein n=1 Tax=Streptomyces sp. NBC_01622 TaxID=2975903 RepID=UPI0038691B54|nr:hypothetical protein OH768_24960 [Streptomyces sp. NBC_01622]